jgi:cellobiose transport system substrate-binding protein
MAERRGSVSRRRLLGGAAALGLGGATGLLGGCGSNVSISPDPHELVLWYWARSISPTLLGQAASQIPETTARLRADLIGGTFDTKLRTSLAGGAYIPDITAVNSNCALYFPNEDLFTDLNTLGAEQRRADFFDWKWALGTAPSGRQVFWPMDTGPTGLYYRSDIFEKAGLPSSPEEVGAATRSWDELVELAAKLRTDADVALTTTALIWFNQVINASEVRWFDRDDTPVFTDADSTVRRAWDIAVAAVRAGGTGNLQTATDQNAGWVGGQVAGHVEAVWWAEILADTAPDTAGKWRLADQPDRPGNSGGSFLGVPATAKDPEAAFAFLSWLTTPEHQAASFNEIQLFPSSPASFTGGTIRSESDFFGDQDALSFFSRAAKSVPLTYVSPYENQTTAFTTELTNVESGGKDANQAWDDAVAETSRILAKRGLA